MISLAPARPVLLVDGVRYGGWTGLRASAGVDRASGSFDISLTERWPGASAPQPIRPGSACTLMLGAQTIITGYVDRVSRGLDAQRRAVSIAGRDKTADLVDCAAAVKQYRDRDLLQIAQDQCAPFDVEVTATADLGAAWPRVAVEPGETVFELIERLARQRGVLLMSDGAGGLILGHPDQEALPVALVEGKNLLAIEAVADWSRRFSEITALGQTAGSNEWNGEAAAHPKALAQDQELIARGRHRPRVLISEDGEADLARRAEWEQRVAYGRSLGVRCRLAGWEYQAGALWRPGKLVTVQAPGLAVQEELLIVSTTWTLDQGGTVTDLELTRPEAFDPDPSAPAGDGSAAAGSSAGDWLA